MYHLLQNLKERVVAMQGRHTSEEKVKRVISLLATELTIQEIAERLGLSRNTIVTINRKHAIRAYRGRRNGTWEKYKT